MISADNVKTNIKQLQEIKKPTWWLLPNFYTKLDLKYIISPYCKPLSAVSKRKGLLFRERMNFAVSEEPSPFGRHKIEIVSVDFTSVQSISKCLF